MLIWSFFSQFVIPLTDFADLEVFHDDLSGYGIKFIRFCKTDFCNFVTLEVTQKQIIVT